jgi:hypothetical protein
LQINSNIAPFAIILRNDKVLEQYSVIRVEQQAGQPFDWNGCLKLCGNFVLKVKRWVGCAEMDEPRYPRT